METGNYLRSDLIAFEESEIRYWSSYYQKQDGLESASARVGGAFACAVPELDILAMNRVIGLGLREKVGDGHFDAIIRFYRNLEVRRFFIQLPPYVLNDDLRSLLNAYGFRHLNNWVKLAGKPGPCQQLPETGIEVRSAGRAEADLYARTLFDCFDWKDERLVEWLARTTGQRGYRHYLGWSGNTAVAAAAMYRQGDYASMAFAGTLPGYRGMGAQIHLIHARMKQAMADGCRWVIAETAEEIPGKPVPSYRNLLKMGLARVYSRQNWIYEF